MNLYINKNMKKKHDKTLQILEYRLLNILLCARMYVSN